jgi:hypothetical protein
MPSMATIEAHILEYDDTAHQVDGCFRSQAPLTFATAHKPFDLVLHNPFTSPIREPSEEKGAR